MEMVREGMETLTDEQLHLVIAQCVSGGNFQKFAKALAAMIERGREDLIAIYHQLISRRYGEERSGGVALVRDKMLEALSYWRNQFCERAA